MLGLVAPSLTLACLLAGSWWMGLTIVTVLVAYPIFDALAGSSTETDPLQEGKAHNVILHIHGLFVPLLVCVLTWRVQH